MRIRLTAAFALALSLGVGGLLLAQGDADRVIPGGGIFIPGWTGKVDSGSARQGRVLKDAKVTEEGNSIHIITGPATTFWNPANTASGDYTVKATFMEPKFMDLNSHPHSYGIFIGGQNMGTDQMSLVYCVAYGSGQYLVRGFGPAVFTLQGQKADPAVHRAAAVGQPVTQNIQWRVKGGKAECSINGTVVASYDKAALVKPGQLRSTDGVYGIRFTHNVEAVVTGFSVTKG